MDYLALGKTGEKIPVLGMGTWKLKDEQGEGVRALKKGLELGMRFIDTAEMYGTEDLVGEAIKNEKDLFLATKVSPHNFHYDDVIKACERSLKNLGTRQVDLYQLHWPNHRVEISETMRAMEKLVDEGKIRHIGVSNFSIAEVKEAQAAMKKYEIVSNQIEYSVLVRDPERGTLDFCKKEGITVIAYSPLGQGALYTRKYKPVLDLLGEIGAKYGKSPTQVALNWVLSKGNVSAIPKAGKTEHMIDNCGAVGWKMTGDDIARIDSFLEGTESGPELGS